MNFTKECLDKLVLKEQTIDDLNKNYYVTLSADFPVTEIRSLEAVKRFIRQGMYFCYELYLKEDTEKNASEKYIGYAYFLKDPLSGWMLLDYLGVKKELRGMGYGSMFMTKILKELGRDNYVFIEVETPEFLPNIEFDINRQKRFDFYIKNGLLDSGVVTDTFTVFYTILVFKEGVDISNIPDKDYIAKLYLRLYNHIIGYRLCKENVRIAYPELTVDSIIDN